MFLTVFPARVVVTSVVRHAQTTQTSGFVQVLDCGPRKVLMRSRLCESRHRERDGNPRGGLRGARGVAVYRDRLVLANAERLLVFDSSWNLVNDLTHPLMGGVHGICADEEGIWAACSSSDLLLKLAWHGALLDVWEWRQNPQLRATLGYPRLAAVDRSRDFRDPGAGRGAVSDVVHLNAVSNGAEELLMSFGLVLPPHVYRRRMRRARIGRLASVLKMNPFRARRNTHASLPLPPRGIVDGSSSVIVSLDEKGSAKVLHRVCGTSVPNHDVCSVNGMLVYNDSNGSRLVAVDPERSVIVHSVPIPGKPAFARGLAHVGEMQFLVGSQAPLAIHRVDLQREEVVESFVLQGEPRESVFGIRPIPDTFDDPPEHLNIDRAAICQGAM